MTCDSEHSCRGLEEGQTRGLKTSWETPDMVKVKEVKGMEGRGQVHEGVH